MQTIELQHNDPCPNCGAALELVPQPTPDQRAAAARRDDSWIPMNPRLDTAAVDTIADLGDLHRCASCGYAARFRA